MGIYVKLSAFLFVMYHIRLGQTDSTPVCDDGWTPYNNFCYYFNSQKRVSAIAAASECNNMDSSLLRITTQDQLTWLQQTLKQYPSSGYWTDLNDNPKVAANVLGTGVWKWGAYEYANMSLIQWNQSPVNDGRSMCAAVNIQGTITDINCRSRQGYICKYSFGSAGGCALGWIIGPTACYWVTNTTDPSSRKSWNNAKADCESKGNGAKLLVIADQNDANFLTGEIPYLSQTTRLHWIGLNSTTVGQWGWYTGDTFNPQLIKWQKEPDNVAGIENCGVLRMRGTFSDRNCSSNANYICYKSQYYTQPTDNLGCGSWIRAGVFCYSFMAGKMSNTWPAARSYCQKMGGDLVKVDSFDKKTWLEEQMQDPANDGVFWTGLNDRQTDGTYLWADGTPLNQSYINWNQEPNDFKGFEDCAVIYTTGQYNDVTCNTKAAAICELDNQASCMSGWKSNGGNCYLFTPYNNASVLMNQNEASAYCTSFGSLQTGVGSLVSVDSQDERTFIRSQAVSMSDNVYGWYTSLNDKGTEGYWTFASGPLLDQTLVDWIGEPSTLKGDDCGMIHFAGIYHQRNCSIKIPFICERYAAGYSSGVSLISSFALLFLLVLRAIL